MIDPQVNVVYAETIGQKPLGPAEKMAPRQPSRGEIRPGAALDLRQLCHAPGHHGRHAGFGRFSSTLAKRLADYKGPEMVTIFGNGCCGNINHIDVKWQATQSSPAAAKRLGTILAADVLKAYPEMKPVSDVTLGVRPK